MANVYGENGTEIERNIFGTLEHREVKVTMHVTAVHQNLDLFPSFSRAMTSISEHTHSLLVFHAKSHATNHPRITAN